MRSGSHGTRSASTTNADRQEEVMQRRSPVSSCAVVVLGLALSWLGVAPVHAATCPSTVRFVPDDTTLDARWSGIAHGQPLPLSLDLGVSCAASTPPCG